MCVNAAAAASDSSKPIAFCACKMPATVFATCSFDALPKPTTACFILKGAYSNKGSPSQAIAAIAAPLAEPKITAVFVF